MPSARTVHTVCSHDCPDSCAVLVTVDEIGRATKVQGDPDHPVTKGFLCAKVAKYLDRVYSRDRLLYPMRRRPGVPKGQMGRERKVEEAFERITWDEALDEIAGKLARISLEHGPESILPYSYAGTIGVLGYGSMDRRFFHRLGASQLDRTICSTAGGDALVSVYGRKIGTDTEHFAHARYIIAWGANIHGNNIHLWPFVERARRNGAKLVVIDPYATRTARLADRHIRIHPGTDTALALGMMRIIINENLYDRAYVEAYTHGFEQLRVHVQSYTPGYVSSVTGIPADDVEQLAREYATIAPAVIRLNYGVQRSQNGGTAARAACMLPCLVGAWRRLGGGLQLSTSGAFVFNKQALERPDIVWQSPLGRPARMVNMSSLGHALTELGTQGDQPPIKAVFVYNSNPAAIAPNQNAVLRGFSRGDLFTVVHEQFFTDTTDYADIVLPATTFLEHKDIQGAYGHYYLQLSEQAIAPLGEARSNVWLFSQLAQRSGFTELCFRDSVDDLIQQALSPAATAPGATAQEEAWQQGITFDRIHEQKAIRLQFESERAGNPFLPFSQGGFPTPSGKAEFYSEALAGQGLDALPTFYPPDESRHGAKASRYPLEFLPRKADNFMNSTFANLSTHQHMESNTLGILEMHASDAAMRQISEGDWVAIYNDRGEIRLRAHVNGSVSPGVVAASLNWNKLSSGGNNVNALTSEQLTDIGRGATFYSTLVEVRKLTSDEAQTLSLR